MTTASPPTQQLNLTYEDLLYKVIDEGMNRSDLELLKKHIDDEIQLKAYKETRVKKIKEELLEEQKKLIAKFRVELERQKEKFLDEESDYSSADEIIPFKSKGRASVAKKKTAKKN